MTTGGMAEQQYQKNWYIDDLAQLHATDHFSAEQILTEIYKRFYVNRNNENKHILNDNEYELFLTRVGECLDNVSSDDIIDFEYLPFDDEISGKIPNFLKRQFLRIKFPDIKEYLMLDEAGHIQYMMGDKAISSVNNERIKIRSVQLLDGDLHIVGFFSGRQFVDKGGSLQLMINNELHELEENFTDSKVRYFGREYHRDYTFKVVLNSKTIRMSSAVKFVYKFENQTHYCSISFERPEARLYLKTNCNYWVFEDRMMTYNKHNREILISRSQKRQVFKKELGIFFSTLFAGFPIKRRFYLIYMRALYWLTSFKYRKENIWIYFDKLYKSGDNAECLFRYSLKQNDNVKHYYLINQDSPDVKYFNEERRSILFYKTRKNKILALHASKILATHSSVLGLSGLMNIERHYFANLIKAEISCIQHGLTIQQMPEFQGRVVDNTYNYFCASNFEKRNLTQPEYDYKSRHIHVTGLPRYDGLKDNKKNIILIAPTWRRSVADIGRGLGNKRTYQTYFKNSNYFHIYQNLINNTELMEHARTHDLKVIFLLHPTLSEQAVDFSSKCGVAIMKSTSDVKYETLLREANILITDYSGIQFDFAYMKKPLIYYHPKELPPHYDSVIFDYNANGFGPVIDNEKDLVDTIRERIFQNCIMQNEYQNRVDKFFKYNDHHNCRRIYEYLSKTIKENN